MRFYPENGPVPAELRTPDFLLRMLRATDVELDYDAVMASQEMLLVKSGGRWPVAGFSLVDNLKDLQQHEQDHQERTSFTYTVMNPTETECLGCVYIRPLAKLLEYVGAREALATVGDDEAEVRFWIRQDRLETGLEARLFESLRAWFAHEWTFSRVVYCVNANEARQRQIFEAAGLQPLFNVTHAERSV